MQLTGVSVSEGLTSLALIDLGLLREFVPSRIVSMVKYCARTSSSNTPSLYERERGHGYHVGVLDLHMRILYEAF